ncbi:hypothetical protein SSX86_022920 [Deinandra increscens subsp. villosa]|uniref:Uncharacterized protein n=1 Tax=Deinandra increscens subsp. villosa TaxID=3103831 RepID=A0AAP0GSY6_9ASTR
MSGRPAYNQIPLDFRAPSPSPVASGRRSSVANNEILTEFLHRSRRVPDLVLPDQLTAKTVEFRQRL